MGVYGVCGYVWMCMTLYGCLWMFMGVWFSMDVYGCLWLFMVAWMCNGCLYICIYIYMYIWVSGICPAPAPEGPERGDGRYVLVCMDVY